MGVGAVAGVTGWAFAFPGQGSQKKGMFSAAGVPEQVVAAAKEASEVLGEDLVGISEGDGINETRNAQPALLAAGVGTYRAWIEAGGPKPTVMAGHSLGEYSALVCAGALGFADAVRLVRKRADAMLEAVPKGVGRMTAILGLDEGQVKKACDEVGEGAWPANINAPGQVVISGLAEKVDVAADRCREEGAKRAVPLAVEVPSHCPLMQPAADALQKELEVFEVLECGIPVVQNATGVAAREPDAIRKNLVAQLTEPVNWVVCVNAMASSSDSIAECGPSGVLHALNRRIIEPGSCHSLSNADSIGVLSVS